MARLTQGAVNLQVDVLATSYPKKFQTAISNLIHIIHNHRKYAAHLPSPTTTDIAAIIPTATSYVHPSYTVQWRMSENIRLNSITICDIQSSAQGMPSRPESTEESITAIGSQTGDERSVFACGHHEAEEAQFRREEDCKGTVEQWH